MTMAPFHFGWGHESGSETNHIVSADCLGLVPSQISFWKGGAL